MMRPVPWGSARQRDKLATTITLTRLVLLCKAYEKQHGALPETLQTLVPDYLDAVPRDLWGDQPIRYVKARQLLYSVGPDGKEIHRYSPGIQPAETILSGIGEMTGR